MEAGAKERELWYHVDVNSAFLSWSAAHKVHHQGSSLDLRNVPSVIGGNEKERHGIVLAKSDPAKAYHIKTGEPLIEARRKCPGLMVAPPDYELYVECSRALINLLKQYSPHVHQYSIDEAFCAMEGTMRLWGSPVAFAHQLREEIHRILGFTVNIGVSDCKLLSKMASEFQKPDRVHTLFTEEIQEKMWPLPIDDLFWVGCATSRKLRGLVRHCVNFSDSAPAIYARCTPAKLAVGTATPSLCRRTPDADIRH